MTVAMVSRVSLGHSGRALEADDWTWYGFLALIGVGLVKPGRIAISLGTSDTLFGFMPAQVRVRPLQIAAPITVTAAEGAGVVCTDVDGLDATTAGPARD